MLVSVVSAFGILKDLSNQLHSKLSNNSLAELGIVLVLTRSGGFNVQERSVHVPFFVVPFQNGNVPSLFGRTKKNERIKSDSRSRTNVPKRTSYLRFLSLLGTRSLR